MTAILMDGKDSSMASFAQDLNLAARSSGFAPKLAVVEITGTCTHCQKAQ